MTTKNRRIEDSARQLAFSAILEPSTIFTVLENVGVSADLASTAADNITVALMKRVVDIQLSGVKEANIKGSQDEFTNIVGVRLPSVSVAGQPHLIGGRGIAGLPAAPHIRERDKVATERALQQRMSRGGDRLRCLINAVEEILGSDDESDLKALEDFVGQYQKTEELELVKKLRDTSFLLDEPRVHRARLHAKLQKAIRDEFQFYNQATLAERIGGETRAALQRIRRWIERGELFSVEDGKKLIPEFLIDWETNLPHPLVAETISNFPENTSGWTLAYWMCQGHELLMGLRPVDIMSESPHDYQQTLKSLSNEFDF